VLCPSNGVEITVLVHDDLIEAREGRLGYLNINPGTHREVSVQIGCRMQQGGQVPSETGLHPGVLGGLEVRVQIINGVLVTLSYFDLVGHPQMLSLLGQCTTQRLTPAEDLGSIAVEDPLNRVGVTAAVFFTQLLVVLLTPGQVLEESMRSCPRMSGVLGPAMASSR
jgi:hypothetical protein